MRGLEWAGIAVAVVAAAFVLDRLLLWMERRGWIYYRLTRHPTGASIGNAFLEVQSLLDPGARNVIEERSRVHEDESEAGDPPEKEV